MSGREVVTDSRGYLSRRWRDNLVVEEKVIDEPKKIHRIVRRNSSRVIREFFSFAPARSFSPSPGINIIVLESAPRPAPPPSVHLRLFWRRKKKQVLFSDKTSHA
jgi:hypothetical protein